MRKPYFQTELPPGTVIQPWHWWLTLELSMTEAERAYIHGHPLTGQRLEIEGRLFEIRIQNITRNRL